MRSNLVNKLIQLVILVVLTSVFLNNNTLKAQVLIPTKEGNNNVILLNGVWKFKYLPSTQINGDSLFIKPDFNDSKWATIKVPGNWELQGFAEPKYGGDLKEGTGLYRKTFNVSPGWKNRLIYLAFDGVQYGYDLWINGKYAGSFASSYNRQTFEITRLIMADKENSLAVKVSTRSKGWDFDTNDEWSLSGIIRDVTLFSLPETHIKDVVVKTFVENSSFSTVSVLTLVERANLEKSGDKLKIAYKLTDADGKLIKEISSSAIFKSNSDTVSVVGNLAIKYPKLWTAETPYLYNLSISLTEIDKEFQRNYLKIGIRQVTIEEGILKLNGTPVKLRGVNHHDLSPVNGTAVTEQEIREDLILMKRANINFVRSSHYPPHHRLIELCDSMGLYVMDEVPFGFGDKNLLDSTFIPVLNNRASATIWRDKNSPSVIVWSVGNENKLTGNGLKTGEYVKKLDSTRPYCFPTVGSYFSTVKDDYPKQVDILAPHYPNPAQLSEYADMFDRPMIISEYAHALGLDFDRMEALWEIMYRSPKIAGGAVWHFFDQGILRKSEEKVDLNKFTKAVWKDPYMYYDNFDDKGGDGIVYANRIPQVDYWQVRKVYSPVKVAMDKMSVKPGKQSVRIKSYNRFDFTNLSEIRCNWDLYEDTTIIQKGNLDLKCAPRDSVVSAIDIVIPEKSSALYYMLKLRYSDKDNYQFFEKTFQLSSPVTWQKIETLLKTTPYKPVLKDNNTVTFNKGVIKANTVTGMVQLLNADGKKIIADGPYARVGRKTGLCMLVDREKISLDSINVGSSLPWFLPVLKKPNVSVQEISSSQIEVNYKYERGGSDGEFIEGIVRLKVTDTGLIEVNYDFKPINAKGIFLETGLSFLLPRELTEFRWTGMGPYPSYPGKESLNEFGMYHLNSSDINYQGNRSGVEVALISDKLGNGFAVVCDRANLAMENTPDGILLSHNADLSSRYNKKVLPEKLIRAKEVKQISGHFTLIPVDSKWPPVLQQLFGKSESVIYPFRPFYHSYDQ